MSDNENNIKGIVNKIVSDVLRETKYYHGTPNKTAADSIMKNGLGNGKLVANGGAGYGFESAPGRQYITKEPGNATRYATMMNDGNDDGYVLEFDIDDNDDALGVDEDEVGHIIGMYLNGKGKLPFREELLGLLNKDDLNNIKAGRFAGYAACKKIIDRLSRDEVVHINQSSSNATTSRNIKPTNAYSIRRPSQEEKTELFKSKDFQPFNAYFDKNRRQYV